MMLLHFPDINVNNSDPFVDLLGRDSALEKMFPWTDYRSCRIGALLVTQQKE
jgi:hypothetical protein